MTATAEKIKAYYDAGKYSDAMLHVAVEMNTITAAEYAEITGSAYVADYAKQGGSWGTNTALNLSTLNPILKNRELVIEEDTGKAKIGDGATHWLSLSYIPNWGPVTISGAAAYCAADPT